MKKTALAFLGTVFLIAGCTTLPAKDSPTEPNIERALNYNNLLKPKVKNLRKADPTHLLFVGNSYLYYGDSVHNHVRRMVEAANIHDGSDLKYKSATVGGAAIFDHNIDHLLEPENLRVDRPFEVVILQGGSAAPLSDKRRRRFAQTIAKFSEKIEYSGGETVLYMTHAYVKPHARFRPDMLEDIASLYISAANDNDALVIPVGLAFEEAYRRRPDMELHKSFDGSHPSLAGTYLAAATVYASLYGNSPVGNSYDYYGAIDPDTALFLQNVAQDSVTQFFGR